MAVMDTGASGETWQAYAVTSVNQRLDPLGSETLHRSSERDHLLFIRVVNVDDSDRRGFQYG